MSTKSTKKTNRERNIALNKSGITIEYKENPENKLTKEDFL